MPIRPPGECFHGEFKTEAIGPDTVFLGHFYVIEIQGVRIAPPDTQFLFLGSDFKTLHAFFDNQRIDTLMAFFRVGLRNHQVDIG